MVVLKILFSCIFSTTGYVEISPFVFLAAMTETSFSNFTNFSTMRVFPENKSKASSISDFELIL